MKQQYDKERSMITAIELEVKVLSDGGWGRGFQDPE